MTPKYIEPLMALKTTELTKDDAMVVGAYCNRRYPNTSEAFMQNCYRNAIEQTWRALNKAAGVF